LLHELRRRWARHRLRRPEFAHLFGPDTGEELVSIDCETTGLDPRTAEILTVGAVKIRGERILTSQRLELVWQPRAAFADALVRIHRLRPRDVAAGLPPEAALARTLDFIGPRPLVGYYLAFDLAMLNKYARPLLGTRIANRAIEVSRLYYDWRARQLPPGAHIDLRFETIRQRLDLPTIRAHDALNDALLAAMIYLRLKGGWQPPPSARRS
jgi:DNA polymerase-3 subunit epsilon